MRLTGKAALATAAGQGLRGAPAHEVGPIVVFLASDESIFATGQTYSADGGMTI
jgi:NAD(P)-dependent dehydrogenase (short-subunit alcohol dehydrogenase family)